jgi:hypothetical protein
MSAGQIAALHRGVRAPIVVVLLIGAFAVGGLTGFSLPRVAGSDTHLDAAAGSAAGAAIPGVAVNSMSDAAERAFAGSAAGAAIPGVAVNSMSDAAERAFAGQKAFHLEKVCDTATHCVVTSSSFKPLAEGTEITYSGPDANHLTAVITVRNGTATGHCAIGSLVGYGDPSLPARCTFNRGTGRLTQFHLDVKVTTTAEFNPWYWDGTYWFGNGGPRRP